MFEFIWMTILFLITVSIIIVFHEFGHFIFARLSGVKVLRFSVGFGKVLLRYIDKRGTEFALSAIPLGGYVKILDASETFVPDAEKHLAFNFKPLWKKLLIVFAGPAFNFIFALLAFWFMFMIGVTYVLPKIGIIQPNSIVANAKVPENTVITQIDKKPMRSWNDVRFALFSAWGSKKANLLLTVKQQQQERNYLLDLTHWRVDERNPNLINSLGITPYIPPIPPVIAEVELASPADIAGIKAGDKILFADGKKITDWQNVLQILQKHQTNKLSLIVERNGKQLNFTLHPEIEWINGQKFPRIGVRSNLIAYPSDLLLVERFNPLQAFLQASDRTAIFTLLTLKSLYMIVTGKVGVSQIAGPLTIAQGAANSMQMGYAYFLEFLALISISVGMINLLPIPILDGGHILLYLYEAIRGKPLSDVNRMRAVYIGILILIMLTCVAFYNDLLRLFS